MYLFSLSPKQAAALLPFFLLLPVTVLASELVPRAAGSPCCIGSCPDDENGNEEPTLDGPTSDKTPGMGVEFESAGVLLENLKCDLASTYRSKTKMINNRQGTNWKLTADTLAGTAGQLAAEYILDGKQIKIGSGAAAAAAGAVAKDIIAWNPSADMANNKVTVEDSTCNPWEIKEPGHGGGMADMTWAPQVTAPLPLEAINDLFSKAVAGQNSPLLSSINPGRGMVFVNKDFFQSKPNGISSTAVKDDVLGFFSLVMSYAKGAKAFEEDASPKELTSIMPRTDFTNLFKQVKSAVPGTLYDIVKVLACYKNTANGAGVEIDSTFCTGTLDAPHPNGQMDRQKFILSTDDGRSASCTVQEWIQSIQDGHSPDRLTTLDQIIDGQVGAFKDALENVLNTNRAVPLFEFRRLRKVKAGDMQSRVASAEQAILDYHHAHASPPRFMRRRRDANHANIKRTGVAAACTTAAATTATGAPKTTTGAPHPTTAAPSMPKCYLQNQDPDQGITTRACVCGSTTLPLLKVPSATVVDQSCSYTAMPSSHVSNPISIETEVWTRNCQACTLVGGIADKPSCTSVSKCTPTASVSATPSFAVFLSNNSIPIGAENNLNNGDDMRKAAYSKLRALCSDKANMCDSTTGAVIEHIPTIMNDRIDYETLTFTIQDSHYDKPADRDRMLGAAIATWQQAAAKSCKDVEYKYARIPTQSGCGKGPLKRDLPKFGEIEERSPVPCAGCAPPVEEECTAHATMCAGPDHIGVVLAGAGGAYANRMDIQISRKLEGNAAFNEFLCNLFVQFIVPLAMPAFIELVGVEIAAEINFEALCANLAEQFNPSSKRGLIAMRSIGEESPPSLHPSLKGFS